MALSGGLVARFPGTVEGPGPLGGNGSIGPGCGTPLLAGGKPTSNTVGEPTPSSNGHHATRFAGGGTHVGVPEEVGVCVGIAVFVRVAVVLGVVVTVGVGIAVAVFVWVAVAAVGVKVGVRVGVGVEEAGILVAVLVAEAVGTLVAVMVGVGVGSSVLVKKHSRTAPGWRTARTLSSPGSKAAVLLEVAPRRL